MTDDILDKKPVSKKLVAGAGTSVIAFTSIVFAYIDSKSDAIQTRLDTDSAHVRQYVDARNIDLEKKLDRIESVLVRIDDRIYEIIKSQNNKQGE